MKIKVSRKFPDLQYYFLGFVMRRPILLTQNACWVIFPCFCCPLLIFFSKLTFLKIFSERYQSVRQFGSKSGLTDRTYVLSVLIWVQTVCKGYQQMTKVAASKEVVNAPVSKLNIINLATHQSYLKSQTLLCLLNIIVLKFGQQMTDYG